MQTLIPKTGEMLRLFNQLRKTGRIFTSKFIKKDGTVRVMNCRIGVKRHLKGGKLRFDPVEKGLLTVFDMQKKGYRFINLNTMMYIQVGDTKYLFILQNFIQP